MLVEQPARRPTVFEVLRVAHEMSGTRPEVDYVSISPPPHRAQPHLKHIVAYNVKVATHSRPASSH